MGSRLLAAFLALTLAGGNPPAPAERHPDLSAGISLLKEGDFEGAVVKLDAAVRSLETEGAASEAAQAYLFLGIAYLELDQEALARGKFAQALARQPQLQLDVSEFSAQVIRIFETVRQEAAPAEAEGRKAAAAPGPSGEAVEGGKRKRSALPFLLLGGAAVAGGVALAAGGGGSAPAASPTPSPSATPTPTPSPSPSPTSTPPPTPPPACTFLASPATSPIVDKDGGNGTCRIDASRSDCSWSAVSTASWVRITRGTPGRGDGTVSYSVLVNPGNAPARVADVHLQQDPSARCQIHQEKGFAPGALTSRLAWTSTLQAPGASGKLLFDGAVAALLGPGSSGGEQRLAPGVHRVEARLTSGGGQPGVWRFRFAGALRPGSLRAGAGDMVGLSPDTIAFRFRGLPGERIAFELETVR